MQHYKLPTFTKWLLPLPLYIVLHVPDVSTPHQGQLPCSQSGSKKACIALYIYVYLVLCQIKKYDSFKPAHYFKKIFQPV